MIHCSTIATVTAPSAARRPDQKNPKPTSGGGVPEIADYVANFTHLGKAKGGCLPLGGRERCPPHGYSKAKSPAAIAVYLRLRVRGLVAGRVWHLGVTRCGITA